MEALDDQTFAACMAVLEPFEDAPFLAIAVSGGADSLALTLLANRWARQRGGHVVGLTVDHGLRSSSADEARQTGTWLHAHHIEHHVLTWTGKKPRSGLQHRAREARYAFLTDWCRQHHCLHLMTAHHRVDQAETVAIRKERQSGDTGLAAMAVIRELRGLRLLRPLLGIDRSALEASLQAAKQNWINDPTNANPAFTRNRLRQTDLDIDALLHEAERYGKRRSSADRRLATTLVHNVRIDPAGFARVQRQGFLALPEGDAIDLLVRLLITVGGRPYPPRKRALLRLVHTMRETHLTGETPPSSGTLAGCRILRYRHEWLICRERLHERPVDLIPGQPLRWESHFRITLKARHDGLTVKPLGDRGRWAENTLILKEKTRTLPGPVKARLPSIYRGDRLLAVPALGLFSDELPPAAINLRFCPDLPLANAGFMPHINSSLCERCVVLERR